MLNGTVKKQKLIEYLEKRCNSYYDVVLDLSPDELKNRAREIGACKKMVEAVLNVEIELGREIKVHEKS